MTLLEINTGPALRAQRHPRHNVTTLLQTSNLNFKILFKIKCKRKNLFAITMITAEIDTQSVLNMFPCISDIGFQQDIL